MGKHIMQLVANWVFPSETEYIAGGLLRKSIYPGTANPTQLQMYATDLRGEPRKTCGEGGQQFRSAAHDGLDGLLENLSPTGTLRMAT